VADFGSSKPGPRSGAAVSRSALANKILILVSSHLERTSACFVVGDISHFCCTLLPYTGCRTLGARLCDAGDCSLLEDLNAATLPFDVAVSARCRGGLAGD
jgi:hypothetical protein